MMFTKADRERAERIETALTSLGLNIGVRGEGSPLFKRIHDQNVLINEVVLGLDKLMQSHAALDKEFSGYGEEGKPIGLINMIANLYNEICELKDGIVSEAYQLGYDEKTDEKKRAPQRIKPPAKSRKK